MDHNYDGIKELDNKLPPWWVYGFYATIIFAAVYLVRFEVFNDYNQDEEYEAAVAQAQLEIEAWKNQPRHFVFPDNKDINPNDPASFGFIEIGTVVGPHGVHGEIKVKSSTGFPKR